MRTEGLLKAIAGTLVFQEVDGSFALSMTSVVCSDRFGRDIFTLKGD